MSKPETTQPRPLRRLISDLRSEGRDAAGLACGELCIEAADRLAALQADLRAVTVALKKCMEGNNAR